MKKHYLLVAILLQCFYFTSYSQITFSANDFSHAPFYDGYFLYGTNGGWYGSSWDDKALADIAAGNAAKNVAGVGVKTFRPPLPEDFLESWSYDIRLSEFQHYQTLGVRDNTVMLGWPSAAHRDPAHYNGCADQSNIFANLFEPIWDGGANGTPVNENNYYALYVYKTVSRYMPYTKFWEIVNEPDFDWTGNAYQNPGTPGNWWDNNPSPCDLANLKAPIFHYIRMLRISYEVIKSLDPDALICTGGIGYTSFLDAVLRNTDNPVDGSVTADYPLKGGAYFDVLSFHSYPMYALATWDNGVGGFVYRRHSDAAADEYIALKNRFQAVLDNHGYDDTTYPSKVFICTENNIPQKAIGDHIGSDQAQINYMMKALVESQQYGIRQFYSFVLGDDQTVAAATDPFQVMGLYKRLEGAGPFANGGNYLQQYNNEGIAYKTTSDLLRLYRYDDALTTAMSLPAGIGGAGFSDSIGNRRFVLWARTSVDQSESASATYSFPVAVNAAPLLYRFEWNYSITGSSATIPSVNIPLTGTPIILSENFQPLPIHFTPDSINNNQRDFHISIYPNPVQKEASMKFTLRTPSPVRITLHNATGQYLGTVVNGTSFGSGTHVIRLPQTASLPNGIYYCHFHAGATRAMKKIVIMR